MSLPLKEQLVVSCSMALGCQQGSDQLSLESQYNKDLNTVQRGRNWEMFISLVPVGQDAVEHPGEQIVVVLSSASGHPSLVEGRLQNSHP